MCAGQRFSPSPWLVYDCAPPESRDTHQAYSPTIHTRPSICASQCSVAIRAATSMFRPCDGCATRLRARPTRLTTAARTMASSTSRGGAGICHRRKPPRHRFSVIAVCRTGVRSRAASERAASVTCALRIPSAVFLPDSLLPNVCGGWVHTWQAGNRHKRFTFADAVTSDELIYRRLKFSDETPFAFASQFNSHTL